MRAAKSHQGGGSPVEDKKRRHYQLNYDFRTLRGDIFGGTRSQISGPTPSMTIAMAVIVTTHANNLAEALTVVVMGGLIQVLLGVFRVGLVALRGSFTVASSHKLVSVIGVDIREHEVVVFDFTGATYLDDSAAIVIEQLIDVAATAQTEIIIVRLRGSIAATFDTLNILQRVPDDRVVDSMDDARVIHPALRSVPARR